MAITGEKMSTQGLQKIVHINYKTAEGKTDSAGASGIKKRRMGISDCAYFGLGIARWRVMCRVSFTMKKYLLLSLASGSLILAGCGQKSESTAAPAAAASANASPSFDLTANDTMKFNLTRLEVKAGQEVKVTLTNLGSMPKAAMGHNWVLLKKTTDVKAFVDAAMTAAASEYLPAAQADQVLAHTKMLGPKESDEVTFQAPTEPGEYPFVCSFPGHYLTGMKGVLVVQ